MPYKDIEKRREAARRYKASDKGRATIFAYNHSDEYRENQRLDYQQNKEVHLERTSQYKRSHPEVNRESRRRWLQKEGSHGKHAAYQNMRRATKLQATPRWLTQEHKEEMKQFYINCPEGFDVDHIVPLKSDIVCGLHVPWNLQYLPSIENRSKGNRLVV